MTKQSQSEIRETEEELILSAQNAVSRCNWVIGECGFKWTKKYAKGRTDADFAALVGLSGDQVYQRRRVWETFSDVRDQYPSLKWSHFYVAMSWDDAPECLNWSEENEATVAEMKAWRRSVRGEDLTQEAAPDDWAGDPAVSFVPSEPTPVRDPESFGGTGGQPSGNRPQSGSGVRENSELVAGVARESEPPDDGYTPYRSGAASPAPKEGTADVAVAEKPQPTADQLIKRMTSTLERINKAFTPELTKGFRKLPEKQRDRFIKAVGELSSKAAELM